MTNTAEVELRSDEWKSLPHALALRKVWMGLWQRWSLHGMYARGSTRFSLREDGGVDRVGGVSYVRGRALPPPPLGRDSWVVTLFADGA